MIFTQLDNPKPMEKCEFVTKIDSKSITPLKPTEILDLCGSLCSPCGCEYKQEVFGGGESNYQNDKTAFHFFKKLTTDTVEWTLLKGGLEFTLVDDTYGEFVDVDERTSFIIDWDKVYQLIGAGEYQIKTVVNSIGVEAEETSIKYCLFEYDDCLADGTVRVEWWQSGMILNGTEFGGEELYHSIRLKSILTEITPDYIVDSYQNNNRKRIAFQKEVIRKYSFNSKCIPSDILDLFIENIVLANCLKITNFALTGSEIIEKEVDVDSIDETKHLTGSLFDLISLTFIEKVQNRIKRLC